MLAILTLSCVLICLGEPHSTAETQLVVAINQFNNEAKSDPIGLTQQPLTENEVVAAIRFWNDPDALVSAEMLSSFKEIAETRVLPKNAVFDKLTGYDRGGDYIFDVWSVRIRFERPDKSTYAFVLRETVIASRTLQEELVRIKASTGQLTNGERTPGWHRIESRIRDLERRIAESKEAR